MYIQSFLVTSTPLASTPELSSSNKIAQSNYWMQPMEKIDKNNCDGEVQHFVEGAMWNMPPKSNTYKKNKFKREK